MKIAHKLSEALGIVISDPAYFQELLEQARQARTSRYLNQALQGYTKVIDGINRIRSPNNALKELALQAYLGIGDLCREANNSNEAVQFYQSAIGIGSVPPEVITFVALSYAQQNSATPEAYGVYLQYLSNTKGSSRNNDPVVAFLKQQCEAAEYAPPEKLGNILELGQKISNIEPTLEFAHYGVGLVLAKTDSEQEGLQALLQAEQIDASRATTPYYIGVLHWKRGESQLAEQAFQRSLNINPQQPKVLYALGQLYWRSGDNQKALNLFEECISLDKSYAAAYFGAGVVYEQSGDKQKAIARYEEGLHLNPDWIPGLVRLGIVLAKSQSWQESEDILTRVRQQGETSDEVLFYLALAQANLKQYTNAIDAWEILLKKYPNEPKLINNLAIVYYQKGLESFLASDYRNAASLWEKAAQFGNNIREIIQALYEAYFRLGINRLVTSDGSLDYKEAVFYLDKAQSLGIGDPRAKYYWGIAELLNGNTQVAINLLEPLIQSEPSNIRYRYHLALAYVKEGRAKEAAELLLDQDKLEVRFTPGYQIALGNLAVLQAQWEDAYLAYRKALEKGSDYPPIIDILNQLTTVGARANLLNDTVRLLVPLTQSNRTSDVSKRWLSLAYAHQGDFKTALDYVQSLIQGNDIDQIDRLTVGQIYLRRAAEEVMNNNLLGAAQLVENAVQVYPDLPEANKALLLLKDWQLFSKIQSGSLGIALQVWEDELQNKPFDLRLIHNLAILSYRIASELDKARLNTTDNRVSKLHLTSDDSKEFWYRTIRYWATVLHSTNFFESWREDRQLKAKLTISEEDYESIRESIHEQILQDIRDSASNIREAGLLSESLAHQELELCLAFEMKTARLMEDCIQKISIPGWPEGFACGPLMLEWLNQNPASSKWIERLKSTQFPLVNQSSIKFKYYISPLGRQYFLIDEGKSDQAISELEKMPLNTEINALLAQAFCIRGNQAIEQGNTREALEAFERAKNKGASLTSYEEMICEDVLRFVKDALAEDDEDLDIPIEVLEQTLRIVGKDLEIVSNIAALYAEKARIRYNEDQVEEAVQLIRTALKYGQDDRIKIGARIIISNYGLSISDNDPDRAISLLKEALSYEFDDEVSRVLSMLLFGRALGFARSGNREKAISYMLDVLRYNPDKEEPSPVIARRRLNGVLLKEAAEFADKGDYRRAIDLVKEARQYEDDSDTRQILAVLLYLADRYEEAVQILKYEVQINPSNWELKRNLAQVLMANASQYSRKSQFEPAINLVKKAMNYDNDPDISRALSVLYRNYGVSLAYQERFDEAINQLQQSLYLNDTPETHKVLAQVYVARAYQKVQRSDRWGAQQDLREAIRHDPYNSKYRTLLNNIS